MQEKCGIEYLTLKEHLLHLKTKQKILTENDYTPKELYNIPVLEPPWQKMIIHHFEIRGELRLLALLSKKLDMSKEVKKTYSLVVEVNGLHFQKVDISQHYLEKHSDITDELILELLKLFVDKKTFQPDKLTTDYFVLEKILYQGKKYKLIWQIENENSLIVVNCYRIKKKW